MKHTPGNWRVGKCASIVTDAPRNHDNEIDFHYEKYIDFYGGELICESIQNENDAHLIAAAPEMLEALEIARDAIASQPIDAFGEGSTVITLPTGESGEMKWPIRDELIDKFNKVIAKAKGER